MPRRYNYRCIVCNDEVEFQEHGHIVAIPKPAAREPTPPDPLFAASHTECLHAVASKTHDFSRPQPLREWHCLICWEPADLRRGFALITAFGHRGEHRVGRAENYMAHATCARSVAHQDYQFVTRQFSER